MNGIIEIPGEAISLKNSKKIVKAGRFPRIVPSDAYKRWETQALPFLRQSRWVGQPWQYPLRVSIHFFRQTRRKFDYINLAQGPLDMLQAAGIIADDDVYHVIPGDFSWSIDRGNPRTIIKIEELSNGNKRTVQSR